MENSKQMKSSEEFDMISILADPILHLILSHLQSTEEVTRTSILSTRWRYLWTLVPSIDIDSSRRLDPHKEFKYNKFDEFVSHVLAKNSCPLLEELKLKNIVVSRSLFSVDYKTFNRSIQVSCPKLVFLELQGKIDKYKCSGLDSLRKAVIQPNISINTSTMRELLSGISHVESLSINRFIFLKSHPVLKKIFILAVQYRVATISGLMLYLSLI